MSTQMLGIQPEPMTWKKQEVKHSINAMSTAPVSLNYSRQPQHLQANIKHSLPSGKVLLPAKNKITFERLLNLPWYIFICCGIYSICRGIYSEKAMAPHSSPLAWKIPWTEEPGRLQSRGLRRVRHNWATSLSLFTFMCWRRKWQPTPVSLPGESQGQGSLVGCHLWGRRVGHDWSDLAAYIHL